MRSRHSSWPAKWLLHLFDFSITVILSLRENFCGFFVQLLHNLYGRDTILYIFSFPSINLRHSKYFNNGEKDQWKKNGEINLFVFVRWESHFKNVNINCSSLSCFATIVQCKANRFSRKRSLLDICLYIVKRAAIANCIPSSHFNAICNLFETTSIFIAMKIMQCAKCNTNRIYFKNFKFLLFQMFCAYRIDIHL